jgi:hypothetical protein
MSKDQKKNNKRKLEENNLAFGGFNNLASLHKSQKTFHSFKDKRKFICISSSTTENISRICYHCEVHGDKDICNIYECSGINTIPKLTLNSYYN